MHTLVHSRNATVRLVTAYVCSIQDRLVSNSSNDESVTKVLKNIKIPIFEMFLHRNGLAMQEMFNNQLLKTRRRIFNWWNKHIGVSSYSLHFYQTWGVLWRDTKTSREWIYYQIKIKRVSLLIIIMNKYILIEPILVLFLFATDILNRSCVYFTYTSIYSYCHHLFKSFLNSNIIV